jgi:hypothetical protein
LLLQPLSCVSALRGGEPLEVLAEIAFQNAACRASHKTQGGCFLLYLLEELKLEVYKGNLAQAFRPLDEKVLLPASPEMATELLKVDSKLWGVTRVPAAAQYDLCIGSGEVRLEAKARKAPLTLPELASIQSKIFAKSNTKLGVLLAYDTVRKNKTTLASKINVADLRDGEDVTLSNPATTSNRWFVVINLGTSVL